MRKQTTFTWRGRQVYRTSNPAVFYATQVFAFVLVIVIAPFALIWMGIAKVLGVDSKVRFKVTQ